MTRVLYAEDDPQIAEMVRFFFTPFSDFEVSIVDSGRGCLKLMAEEKFDVLLLDLLLPGMDGLHVLGELTARRDPTPVIMVSGRGQNDLAVRALRAGAADCIDKNSPDFRRIPDVVRQTLNRLQRASQLLPSPADLRTEKILLVENDAGIGEEARRIFSSSGQQLHLEVRTLEIVDAIVEGRQQFAAVVLGPSVGSAVMLDALRRLRGIADACPVVIISRDTSGETAVAAFKLGASDYLLQEDRWPTELVFSLNHLLKQRDMERLNLRLTDELATLNRSLAGQVAVRTSELQKEVEVRRRAELRAAEQATRSQALATRILRVQEDERYALAQELHDQIGQLLTGQRFQIEAARARNPSAELSEALALTDDLLSSVRALTLQLRPRVLDDLGLQPALEWLAKNFRRQTGIEVDLDLNLPSARLPRALETAIYRIVQEALTNVARHSSATSAAVTLSSEDDALRLEIVDQGNGFDVTLALARNDSLGLAGAIERANLAGGRLELFSEPGRGTRVQAEFPLGRVSKLAAT